MRCFIAIDIDQPLRREIARLQDDLRRQVDVKSSEAKWVEPDNIHLTLKFLGEVRDREITDVCRLLEQTAADHPPFSLDVQGVGTFGRPARVLWIGIAPHDALAALQQDLDQRLADAGWPKDEKKFSAHLTLCRIKSPRAAKAIQNAARDRAAQQLGSVSVDSVCVYKSDLTSTGPLYTLISRSMLE